MSDTMTRSGPTRFSIDAEAEIRRVRGSRRVAGRLVEVGTGGCRIRFEAALDYDAHTPIEMLMKLESVNIRSLGLVTSIGDDGFSMEATFVEMGARAREDLAELLRGLPLTPSSSRVDDPRIEEPKQPIQAETEDGIRVRRHPRHCHETPVWLAYPDSVTQFAGTTCDLSAGGCMIRLSAQLAASVGSEIEVWIMSGLGIFKIRGWVRRQTMDLCGVGVEFQWSNVRVRREIEKLVSACMRQEEESGQPIRMGRVQDRGTV